MPAVSIVLSEEEHTKLQDEYRKMAASWRPFGHQQLQPTFEQWLGKRAAEHSNVAQPDTEMDDIRIFNALEKLVTRLHQRGFALVHVGKHGITPAQAVLDMAQNVATDLKMQPQYAKRIQELFEHYVKSAKEVADSAHIGITNRTYGTLHEAYRQLAERTEKALQHLGDERAIGRVEGGIAILVSLDVIDRDNARKRTDAFKQQVRAAQRSTWVGKVFGGATDKD